MLVGRPEGQDLPPRLARIGEPVHECPGRVAQPPAGQRRGMEQDAGGAGVEHGHER